jgi:hypothetical protein
MGNVKKKRDANARTECPAARALEAIEGAQRRKRVELYYSIYY